MTQETREARFTKEAIDALEDALEAMRTAQGSMHKLPGFSRSDQKPAEQYKAADYFLAKAHCALAQLQMRPWPSQKEGNEK